MWDRLRRQVATELEQLRYLIEAHRELLNPSSAAGPGTVEIMALAAVLHSFYNGIENILKRIAIETGEDLPGGEFWHRDLLDASADASPSRPAVISGDMREALADYLAFRHFFRHAYTFDLRWERMRPLAVACEPTFRRFKAEVESFLQTGPLGQR